MKLRIVLYILALIVAASTALPADDDWSVKLPDAVKNVKPGRYELTTPRQAFYAPKGVKAVMIIPAGMTREKPRPLVIFYHGAVSGDNNAYRTNSLITVMAQWAAGKKVLLLSVQNMWGIDTAKRDTTRGIIDTLEATMDYIDALVKADVARADSIYASGFSAGGLVALCAGIFRPDLILGVADIKGNFYPDVAADIEKSAAEWRDFLKLSSDKRTVNQISVLLCMGSQDAPRVLKQAPEAKAYLEGKGIKHDFKIYKNEGHSLTGENLNDFWKMIENTAGK